jgi:hypothetical protein
LAFFDGLPLAVTLTVSEVQSSSAASPALVSGSLRVPFFGLFLVALAAKLICPPSEGVAFADAVSLSRP